MKVTLNLRNTIRISRRNHGTIELVRSILTAVSVCSVTARLVVQSDKVARGWTPVPLRLWFWIPLVTFMILLALGLEIALHFSNKQQGRFSVPVCHLRFILRVECCRLADIQHFDYRFWGHAFRLCAFHQ
jgi:hypothetical protein